MIPMDHPQATHGSMLLLQLSVEALLILKGSPTSNPMSHGSVVVLNGRPVEFNRFRPNFEFSDAWVVFYAF